MEKNETAEEDMDKTQVNHKSVNLRLQPVNVNPSNYLTAFCECLKAILISILSMK